MIEHNHHHHHHHGPTEPLNVKELDPANQALAEALKISFGVLKLVMAGVLILFLASGAYQVQQNEVAVVLRFGKVIGEGENRIKTAGWKWRWPYIEEVVKIPAASQIRTLDVDSFWYYLSEKEKATGEAGYISPKLEFVKDGYSLTASRSVAVEKSDFQLNNAQEDGTAPVTDYNILHSKWRINYSIQDPVVYIENLWDGTDEGWRQVRNLLRGCLSDAVILTSARRDIDWILRQPKLFRLEVERHFTACLNGLNVGVDGSLELIDPEPPRQVKAAFDMASGARSESDKLVTRARANANETLNEAQAQAKIIVAEAKAYSTKVINAARADAEYMREVLSRVESRVAAEYPETDLTGQDRQEYEQKREEMKQELLAITVDQLYHEALRKVIDNAYEVIVLQDQGGKEMEVRTLINRNAALGPVKKEDQDAERVNAEQYLQQ